MSTPQPRLPAFVSRPETQNDVYESDEYYEVGQAPYDEQFIETFFGEFIGLNNVSTPQSRFAPPPPSHVPARPAYDIPSDYSYYSYDSHADHQGFRALPPWSKKPGDATNVDGRFLARKPGMFFFIFEDAYGRWFFGARVTRKLVFAVFVAFLLMVLGLQSVNGALDLFFNVIW